MNLQLLLHNIAVRLPQPGDAAATSQHEHPTPGHPRHTDPYTTGLAHPQGHGKSPSSSSTNSKLLRAAARSRLSPSIPCFPPAATKTRCAPAGSAPELSLSPWLSPGAPRQAGPAHAALLRPAPPQPSCHAALRLLPAPNFPLNSFCPAPHGSSPQGKTARGQK